MRRGSRDLDIGRGHDRQWKQATVQHRTPRHVPPQERLLPQPAVALFDWVQHHGEHLQQGRDSEQAYHCDLGLQRYRERSQASDHAPLHDAINRREPELGQVPAPALGNAHDHVDVRDGGEERLVDNDGITYTAVTKA
ncbi:hypothetical protein AU210_015694 [Fusarium oxysporum f. sp. radicis-cucumerinum]|uniref:Uncharacterized protein n=1 Tax=Fusarium oxysporum f. sp. radicis-cucumerinum TaxID=327505 RepID=A0A2H3FQX9_FUSOX|nr:hypothetical protein AU210_015694 [Fusarium oxysporum f. sp. radicis-cucumerinum]